VKETQVEMRPERSEETQWEVFLLYVEKLKFIFGEEKKM
jgi:hypothetical protein